MKKSISFKQALLLIPLMILLVVFAIYPIITSIVYSFFDYQTNDPSKANLYISENFNNKLFVEDAGYISWYLSDDEALIYDATNRSIIESAISKADNMATTYKDKLDISKAERDTLKKELASMKEDVNKVFDNYKNITFSSGGLDSYNLLFSDMEKCFIESNFVGLSAYLKLLKDTRFGDSLKSTLTFTVISVFFELVLGLGLALIMNKAIKGIGIVRTTSLIPWAIPTAVSALMWSYMYDGSSGIIAEIFSRLGFIETSADLLLSKAGAMAAAIIADVWKTTPYMALLLLAGLQIIDQGLYESARVDGASPVRTFFSITLPLLMPSMVVALLFRTLDAFRVYDLIAILTGGANGTETLSIYSYKLTIGQSNYGYGSVVVLAMAICVAIIAFIFVKFFGAELVSDE